MVVRCLFKVKCQRHHIHICLIDALCENLLRGIQQVATVLLQNVVKSETKFQFRNHLEERQVEIAPQTCFKAEGEGVGAQQGMLLCRQVVICADASNDVGAVVIKAWPCKFYVNGQ